MVIFNGFSEFPSATLWACSVPRCSAFNRQDARLKGSSSKISQHVSHVLFAGGQQVYLSLCVPYMFYKTETH